MTTKEMSDKEARELIASIRTLSSKQTEWLRGFRGKLVRLHNEALDDRRFLTTRYSSELGGFVVSDTAGLAALVEWREEGCPGPGPNLWKDQIDVALERVPVGIVGRITRHKGDFERDRLDAEGYQALVAKIAAELELGCRQAFQQISDFLDVGSHGKAEAISVPGAVKDLMNAREVIKRARYRFLDVIRPEAESTIPIEADTEELSIGDIVYPVTMTDFGYKKVEDGLAHLLGAYFIVASVVLHYGHGARAAMQEGGDIMDIIAAQQTGEPDMENPLTVVVSDDQPEIELVSEVVSEQEGDTRTVRERIGPRRTSLLPSVREEQTARLAARGFRPSGGQVPRYKPNAQLIRMLDPSPLTLFEFKPNSGKRSKRRR